MTEINYVWKKKNVHKIQSKDKSSFYMGDTSDFSEYISGDYIEELPKKK